MNPITPHLHNDTYSPKLYAGEALINWPQDALTSKSVATLSFGGSNDLKTAEHDINEVMHHSHKHAEAYFIRGLIKAKTENYEGAIKDFTKSIELRPNSAKAYYDRGLAHAMMDEIKQAMQDFSRAIELDPTYAKAYFNRGYWKDIMGDVEGALADLLKAKELSPNKEQLEKIETFLAELET